jgi:type IV pilus assembly protein PilA
LALAAMIMPAAMVPVVGILAALAIPNFIRYQFRAKQSEPRVVLAAMRASQDAFFAEQNFYVSSDANPSDPPSTIKASWDARSCPSDCGGANPAACNDIACAGYTPSGPVYYRYACTATPPDSNGSAYYACAGVGDLDGDGELGAFIVGNGTERGAPVPAIAEDLCKSSATSGQVVDCRPGHF